MINEIKITSQSIKLDQFLKFSGISDTGGQSKFLIQNELVYVNGELCLKRGKILKKGDLIQVLVKENVEDNIVMSVDFIII